MNDIEVKDGELIVTGAALQALHKATMLKQTIEALKKELDEIEKPFKKTMMKSDVKKYSNDFLTASKVEPTYKETVNTDAMKADGIYDKYKLLVPKAGYVRMSYRKEKK